MTLYNYISTNYGRIKEDIRYGLISTTIIRHFEVYCRYDYYRKAGNTVSNSVLCTSEDYKCNERWIYKVIKNMERDL